MCTLSGYRLYEILDIARRYADSVVREVGPSDGQACVVPGHQIAEMALARLYVLTGEKKYLDEAKFFSTIEGRQRSEILIVRVICLLLNNMRL